MRDGKKFYYILGFLLVVGIIIFGIDFNYELTGKAIDDFLDGGVGPWPQFGQNPGNSRFFENSTNDNLTYGEIITFEGPSGTGSLVSPIVSENFVYVVFDNGELIQLNASNVSQEIARLSGKGIVTNPVVYEDFVFACANYNCFRLDKNNVSIVFENVSSYASDGNLLVYLGYLYFLKETNKYIQVNAFNFSEVIGTYACNPHNLPSFFQDRLIIDCSGDHLVSLDANNISNELDSSDTLADLANSLSTSPIISNNSIYVGSRDNFYKISPFNLSDVLEVADIYYQFDPAVSMGGTNPGLYMKDDVGRLVKYSLTNFSDSNSSLDLNINMIALSRDYVYASSPEAVFKFDANNLSRIVENLSIVTANIALSQDYIYFVNFTGTLFQVGDFVGLTFSKILDNSPINEGEESTFETVVEDTNGSVYLNIDGSEEVATNVYGGVYQVNLTLNFGNYEYYWEGYDFLNNSQVSETREYLVNEKPIESTTPTSSGISSSLITKEAGEISESGVELIDNKINQKINFSIDEENYEMSLEHIYRTDQIAEFKFDSLDEPVLVKVGEIKDIDLDKDLMEDISLELLEISDYTTEVDFVLKRKTRPIRDIKDDKDRIKGVSLVEPVIDERKIRSFEKPVSSIFGWFEDLFNLNKIKCRALEVYYWSSSLDLCIGPDVSPTENNKEILKILTKENNFGDYFVIIDYIKEYDCEGCYVIDVRIEGEEGQYYIQNWMFTEEICVPKTCSDLDYNCGMFLDDCGMNLYCGECQYGYDCIEGNCVQDEQETCFDSDDGESYFVKGSAMDRLGVKKDYCSGSTVYEAVCSAGYSDYVTYDCRYGCENGACLAEPWCQDSDPENDVFIIGTLKTDTGLVFEDYCKDSGSVTQYFCDYEAETPRAQTSTCLFGCEEGVCLEGKCYDSDLNDSTVKGYVEDNNGIYEDYCGNALTLYEAICVEASLGQGKEHDYEPIYCEDGCEDGRCLSEKDLNCVDEDGLDFYYQGTLDYRFTDGKMRERLDRCTNGTETIGWTVGGGIYNYDFYCPFYLEDTFPYHSGKMYECPEGCFDGACIVPEKEVSYCDEEGNCKLYLGEYLVFDDYLSINLDYAFTNEELIYSEFTLPQRTKINFAMGSDFEIKTNELEEEDTFDYDFSEEEFFWMEIEVLNIFSNRDSETIYETVATPYVEFSYNIPDYKSNTKKNRPIVRVDTKPVLKSKVVYEKPTVFTKISRGIKGFFDRGDVSSFQSVSKTTKGKSSRDNFVPPVAVH